MDYSMTMGIFAVLQIALNVVVSVAAQQAPIAVTEALDRWH